jgi:hypothetical protein
LVPDRTLVVACGALAREIRAVLAQLGDEHTIDVEYLPASLHNRPEHIAPRVDALLAERASRYGRLVVAYADCGTGGTLQPVLARHGAVALPGAHCYELFAGAEAFAALADDEPGTFYLTDFLVRQFDQLVVVGLGLDRHPELRDTYFGAYRRVVLLSQNTDPALAVLGQAAADRLGLAFEHRHVGLAPFADALVPLLTGAS